MKGVTAIRISVVTGSASGIGLATTDLNDRHEARVTADLATSEGQSLSIDRCLDVAGGQIDAVVANAGSALLNAVTVSVNCFWVTEFREGLLPALTQSDAPRALVTSLMASLVPRDPQLVEAILSDD